MIGIVIALPTEAKYLLENLTPKEELYLADKKAYLGKLANHDVIVAISGIGKVSAALTTQLLLDKFSPSLIVNIGTCGGTNNTVKINEFYAIEKTFQFDFDVTAIDPVEIGYIQEYDRVYFTPYSKIDCRLNKANLATADRFSNKVEDLYLIAQNGCALRDMEGCAIAQVCTSNNCELIMIKGVTDVYGTGTDAEQFISNLQTVCKKIPKVLIDVLNNYK